MWACPQPNITGVVFRNNTIEALLQNEKSKVRGVIVICGDAKPNDAPMLFKDNMLISNFCHVLFGEPYGSGCNTRFHNNTFVRVGSRKDYRTIQIGYWNKANTGHRLIDSVFRGGAGYDHVRFLGEGKRDFSVGWSLTVRTTPGAKVTVRDESGKEVFSAKADAKGLVTAAVLQYVHRPGGKTILTPHTVTPESGGRAATKTVTVDAKKTVDLPVR